MKVGLCWAGSTTHRNDAMRSLPREAVKPLAAIPGIDWVSLARDAWTPEMGEAGLRNGLPANGDWLDTADALLDLDLVISVDTAIAHVAGGLGIPTWLLLAAVPDMRWMLHRSDTPWYKSMTLYRQTIAGEWGPVMERVATDLARLTEQRKAA